MKRNILLLPLLLHLTIFFTLSFHTNQTPSCSFRNYCMGCHSTIENICTSCFNWGFRGIIFPRSFDGFTCQDLIIPENLIIGCKSYSGLQSNLNTPTLTDCHICNSTFLNQINLSQPYCNAKSPNHKCLEITNCLTTICHLSSGFYINIFGYKKFRRR